MISTVLPAISILWIFIMEIFQACWLAKLGIPTLNNQQHQAIPSGWPATTV